jgi:hypothetical protein
MSITPDSFSLNPATLRLAYATALMMAGCGGGGIQEPGSQSLGPSPPLESPSKGNPTAPTNQTIQALQEGARLASAELEGIAPTRVLPETVDGSLLSGATPTDFGHNPPLNDGHKSAASRVPVYRFFNTHTNAHFFTTSTAERNSLRAAQPFMTYEGSAFSASSIHLAGLSPVHRFYDTVTGVHFYTISETERANVVATLPQFSYEGIAYYASTLPGSGYAPLYRFFYAARGFHFYTASQSERDTLIATLPQYTYEGTAYYVPDSTWQTPAVLHTGVTSNQCYQASSDALVACGSAGALALNPLQDGHRTAVNPMSYSLLSYLYLPIGGGGPITALYPSTRCVYDNVTGLVWEGKESTGMRAGTNTYSNRGDSSPNDASTYVTSVNAMRLCGYNDWRLPTIEELQGLLLYSVASPPTINSTWFPNTLATQYWTSASYALDPINVASTVNFLNGDIVGDIRSASLATRLVRGAAWTGTRHMVVSASFPGDRANNAVIDRKAGLTWRRCPQGLAWSGSGCTGVVATFTHAAALSHAQSQAGWRLPNAKELNSLRDLALAAAAADPDGNPLPLPEPRFWSSTPLAYNPSYAYASNIELGIQVQAPRSTYFSVRLVLDH